jgi:hypothetical protein
MVKRGSPFSQEAGKANAPRFLSKYWGSSRAHSKSVDQPTEIVDIDDIVGKPFTFIGGTHPNDETHILTHAILTSKNFEDAYATYLLGSCLRRAGESRGATVAELTTRDLLLQPLMLTPDVSLHAWMRESKEAAQFQRLRAEVSHVVKVAMSETTQELLKIRERVENIEYQEVVEAVQEAAEGAVGESMFLTFAEDAASALHLANAEIADRSKSIEERLRSLEEVVDE